MVLLPEIPFIRSTIENKAEYINDINIIIKPFNIPRDIEHNINKALSPYPKASLDKKESISIISPGINGNKKYTYS